MNIFTIIGCAIGYIFAKQLTGYSATFGDACITAVVCVLINAIFDGLWEGVVTEYPSVIVGILLGYAALWIYERRTS